jgi:nucleosome binding factor SPN SPT16 subunit
VQGQTYARLKNLLLRPPVNNKLRRAVGVLEAHENGFRYSMTGNIKCVVWHYE